MDLHRTDETPRFEPGIDVVADRRKHSRRPCGHMITAFACDDYGVPNGQMFVGHCIDVSGGGIQIALAQRLDSKLMRIEPLISTPVFGFRTAVVFVLRSSVEGDCHTYAGRFIYTDSD